MFVFYENTKKLTAQSKVEEVQFFVKTGCKPNISAEIQIVPGRNTIQKE